MKAVIRRKEEIGKKTMLFEYRLLKGEANFKPGQYFYVDLGNDLVHHFTIVNSPNDKKTLSNATRMRDTLFKNTLKNLELGAEVNVGRIGGNFILPKNSLRHLVFIALGIGITPFISMLRFIGEESMDYKISLIYSDSDKESMPFLDELRKIAENNPNLKLILTVTKDPLWRGENRHVDDNFIKEYFDKPEEYLYYIAGPPRAVESVALSLEKVGIGKDNIKKEDFSGY